MLKEFLDEKSDQYNRLEFIQSDPILVPHSFTNPEDIEISGFLTSTIAWGRRKTIIKNAFQLMNLMGNKPHDFILEASYHDLNALKHFCHRTFNGIDTVYFIKSLKNIYTKYGGLKRMFENNFARFGNLKEVLIAFRHFFFELPFSERTKKHIANIQKGASAKRLNMFLRWMVRKDNRGVDFGLWDMIPPSALYIPLDVHTGNVSRKLKLLSRKQNDWQSVEELTKKLREFNPCDPVKYDYALFGLGIFDEL